MENITDASASKPYLLHIEPATYDLGTGSLNMKEWVDIEGSGELNTVITSGVTAPGCTATSPGTVTGANNAEMRFLTVRNTGAVNGKIAISIGAASPRLTHLTAQSTGDGGNNNFGLCINNSSPTMTDVMVTASGQTGVNYGVWGDQSNITIKQSKITGSGGTFANLSHALRVQHGATANVALTQLVGGALGETGTGAVVRCAGVYDQNFAFFASTCP
jgi:hypothetical protein